MCRSATTLQMSSPRLLESVQCYLLTSTCLTQNTKVYCCSLKGKRVDAKTKTKTNILSTLAELCALGPFHCWQHASPRDGGLGISAFANIFFILRDFYNWKSLIFVNTKMILRARSAMNTDRSLPVFDRLGLCPQNLLAGDL